MRALLIAGTDTDSGKTVLTTAVIAYWQKYCDRYRIGVCKLVQAGVGDRELYQQLFQLDQTLTELNPLYYQAPLAPPLAAAKEGRQVELAVVWQTLSRLMAERDWVLVESAGGLGSPLTAELTVADLAADWRLPVVLIVPVRLGAIAAAVANVALARQARVNLKGIVLNCREPRTQAEIADWTPTELIESLTRVPILGVLPHLPQPTDLTALADAAAQLDLEAIMPQPYWV